ncbi:hypothetical protein CEXT_558941 [Caerostris extrusa]|uniref:Uncharacterized protein n=1 Tax=Caerostris extrusa TaxID=172846 RepID=A0AAV4TIZ3_CAEEX|nr:hypothetical protein CEXT_558941 [Caerostris extrusa]
MKTRISERTGRRRRHNQSQYIRRTIWCVLLIDCRDVSRCVNIMPSEPMKDASTSKDYMHPDKKISRVVRFENHGGSETGLPISIQRLS